jgi:hypothetical protein
VTRRSSGPSERRDKPSRWAWGAWLGLAIFGVSNLLVVGFLQVDRSVAAGAVYGLLVVAIAALTFSILRWRGLAVGLVGGFVLLSVVSGGACTLFTRSEFLDEEASAVMLYILIVAAAGLAAVVYQGQKGRR